MRQTMKVKRITRCQDVVTADFLKKLFQQEFKRAGTLFPLEISVHAYFLC